MSIKCDKWIRRKSTPPTHILFKEAGRVEPAWAGNSHSQEKLDDLSNRFHATPVTDKILNEELKWQPMIEPFEPDLVRKQGDTKLISYGTTSYGYDVSLADYGLELFTNVNSAVINPRKPDPKCFVVPETRLDEDGCPYVLLPPNSYLLGPTVEYFRIPREILIICLGKSTYARSGIAINCTPIEPEFEGNVVIEIANQTNLPAMVYLKQGIAQFLFLEADEVCETSYADRGGKYQGQTGLVHSKV